MNAAGVLSLADWPLRRRGRVSRVHTGDRLALQRIIAMGVLPDTEILLVQKFPAYVFEIQNTRFSIDKELASLIFLSP